MKRAAKYGNGWQPTWITPDEMRDNISTLNGYLLENGRNPEDFIYSVRNRVMIDSSESPECYFNGSIEAISEKVERYKEIGVSHILFDPECEDDDQTFDLIEKLANEFI